MRPPWWPTTPVTVELDDGAEVTVTPCLRCGHPTIPQYTAKKRPETRILGRRMSARGLCFRCYEQVRPTDEWDDYLPRGYERGELLAEWERLHALGETVESAAPRLGLSVRGLETALYRARRAA